MDVVEILFILLAAEGLLNRFRHIPSETVWKEGSSMPAARTGSPESFFWTLNLPGMDGFQFLEGCSQDVNSETFPGGGKRDGRATNSGPCL
jgi:hypothetical protein